MKKCWVFFTCIALIAGFQQASAQSKDDAGKTLVEKPARDFVMLRLTYDSWLNKPDSIHSTGLGRGIGGYLCYDFPIKKTNLSFAAGIGFGASNIYFSNQELRFSDTGTAGQQVSIVTETKDYKKYKLTTAYLEAPFELRYFGNKANRNKGFKAAIGLHVGTLIGAGTKGNYTVAGTKTIDKENTRRYLQSWRFMATARIGWGNFSLFGGANLNGLFKDKAGPSVTPLSLGIVFTGL
jgi:hypothetical protein